MRLMLDRSPDTEAVVAVLRGCNNEISYEDMARQVRLPVARVKAVLASARRIIRTENGVLFGCLRGYGLRLLSDADKVKKPESFKKRVVRGAGREIQDLNTIANFGGLIKSDQHAVTTNRTVLNVIRQQAMVKPEPPKPTIARQPMPDVNKLIPRPR